jgi:HAD superfamily hydrolase (TIGR01509 family)
LIDKQRQSDWAAIFDVDGTMVDNARYHEAAWVELGRRHGFGITPEFYRQQIHARNNDRNIRILLGESASEADIRHLGDEKEQIYRETFRPVMAEIPGLTVVLKALTAEGVACAAASNSPKANVDMVLDGLSIRPYFRIVLDRDRVRIGKPDPEMFLWISAELSIEPRRCVVLEDSASGFLAAQRAGMVCIAIAYGADLNDIRLAENLAAVHQDFTTITPDLLRSFVNGSVI